MARYFVLLALWLAWPGLLTGPASAAEADDAPLPIALLNFTARRVDPQQAQAFSRTLRESFMLEERFGVLEELAMYETLAGTEGPFRLRQARTLLAEGKKAYRAGQLEVAMKKLEAARTLHRQLYSELSRADELADLLLYQGLTLFRMKKTDAARVTFLQMFLLDPSIQLQRAPNVSREALALIEEARTLERQTPLKGLSASFASEIAKKLKVEHLITGVLEGIDEGGSTRVQLMLQIMAPGQTEPESTMSFDLGDFSAGAPPPGASIYRRILGISERVLLEPR